MAHVKAVLVRDRQFECAVSRRRGRTAENGRSPNHYGRSVRGSFTMTMR